MGRRRVAPPSKDEARCAVYARFSSEKQRDESIEDQIAACERFAEANGMVVVATYADKAMSGTSDERPEFQRMIEESRDAEWGTLLVYKLDRFARDRFASAVYRKRLRENGVALTSAMEHIPDSPEGIILESVIDGMNEYYSRNLAQNVRRGLYGNAEKCRANGVRVFGYDVDDDDHFVVNEAEAAHVREAFEMAANMRSRREIIDYLNSCGAKTCRGKGFNYSSLATLLANEKYTGVYTYGPVRKEGAIPAIVSRELFERVNSSRKVHPRTTCYPLTGKLFAHEGGEPYFGTSGTSCNGSTYFYYAARIDGKVVRYRKADVEGAVRDVIGAALREPGMADRVADAVYELAGATAKAKRADDARRRLAEVERGRERLADAIVKGVPVEVVLKKIEEMDAEAERLHKTITECEAMKLPSREWIAEWVRGEIINRATPSDLRQMFTSCTIDAEGTLRVSIPWVTDPEIAKGKRPNPQVDCEFDQFRFGSPYQIRTGDLRLERAAS